ncbi:MAG: aminotransferase class I/II-fold pyridoxal phosphate-dependent enzyme [Actinomycetota bacterium]
MAIPLEPSDEQMRAIGAAALDHVASFIDGLDETSAAGGTGDALEIASTIGGAPPETGRPFDEVLADFGRGAERALEPAGPGYLAYIPGGGLYSAALASFLAAGVNRFVNLAATAPAFVRMEVDVLRWFCDLFGLPVTAGGILTTGGSMANLSAIVTARRARLPEDFLDGTIYVSQQAHASVAKAAAIAGLPDRGVVRVPVTRELRLDVDALADQVARDRSAGRSPFCVVANAGTTNTGAIDPLEPIADLCVREGLWLHVDAAYGGFFQLTERGRERFRGIDRADSITLDPHKGMFLPYGTGSLLVRDAALLRDAHASSGAAYLQDLVAGGQILPSFAEYSPELSREFRGLRVWLPLQLHGVAAFRDALEEKLDLAEQVHRELASDPRLEVPWTPDLSIVAFRLADPGPDEIGANRAFLERINASQRVFLSSTMVHGRFILRIAVLSFRTHADRIHEAIEIVRREAKAL